MARPWTAYATRLLCCSLLFVSGALLLGGSTFALRMRSDAPVAAIMYGLAGILSFLPLLAGRRFFGAFLFSAFVLAGLGGYWWTTIPWDELFKDNGFPTDQAPALMEYLLVASPAILAAFYVAMAHPSILHADLKRRGADLDEVRRAAAVSFLSGAAILVFCGALAGGLIWLMASGIVFRAVAPMPVGIPAIILVGALATLAYAILARRIPGRPPRRPTRPSTDAARPEGLARNPGRRSPS